MFQDLEKFGKISAILAFVFCLAGGLWILTIEGIWDHSGGGDGVWAGLGLYFVGKAFFVGPMLLIASRAVRRQDE